MKRALFTIMILCIILIGCGTSMEGPADTVPDSTQPVIKVEAPEPIVPEPVEEPTVVEVKEPTKEVKELLAKHEKRNIKSMQYLYSDPINKQAADTFYVKGDKIMIKLFEPNVYDRKTYFDTVYLDLSTRTATAYCEHDIDSRCEDNDRLFEVEFDDYERFTPLDWIKMVDYAENKGTETLDDRSIVVLVFEMDDAKYTLKVDEYYGLPVYLEVSSGPDAGIYRFMDLAFNSVPDDLLEHQFEEE